MKPTTTVLGTPPPWPAPPEGHLAISPDGAIWVYETGLGRPRGGVGSPLGENCPRQEARMEMLHALRFWTKLHRMDPAITPEGWSAIYAQLQAHPHWRCGCPNQVLDPQWERLRAWLRKQMEDLGEDQLQET